jgi:hypothetical protein
VTLSEEVGEGGNRLSQFSNAMFNHAVAYYEHLKFFLVANLVLSALGTFMLGMVLYFVYFR